MANSAFEVVKQFERENYLLQDTYIVIRVDGRGFHRFSKNYSFAKPNDERALQLLNKAARAVMLLLPDAIMAYGDSDEYSFLLRKDTALFERREAKLVSTFVSSFTSFYTFHWPEFFPEQPLNLKDGLPTFDGRAVLYPSVHRVRQYFSWRQVDCHINNLYNTTFWALVDRGGMTPQEAENRLIGTLAKDKNEILFSQFGINYNNEPELYKKGTVVVREATGKSAAGSAKRKKMKVEVYHVDIIGDKFWQDRPYLFDE